jgi:hypothetical protein
MKIDRRGIERPAREPKAKEPGERDEATSFDALVAALARPDTKPRREVRDARHGSEVRRRDVEEDVTREDDVELGSTPREELAEVRTPEREERTDEAPARSARLEAQTMPPDIAAYVRFASDAPHDASEFRPAPPPLPWTKGGRDWSSSVVGEGKLPAPPRAPSEGWPGQSANALDASDVDVVDASAPNEIPAARARFAWRAPAVREPTGRETMGRETMGHVEAKADISVDGAKPTLVNPASMGSASVSDGAWLGPTRVSDEAQVSLALAAREERRSARIGEDVDTPTGLRSEGHLVLDVTPSVVRGVTAVLEAATAEPSVGDALLRAASRFAHEDSTIRLSHPELGRVRLQIAMDGDGLDVRAFAESALAARILSESEETLRREIARHGVSLRRMKVRVETTEGTRREDVTPSTARPPRPRR